MWRKAPRRRHWRWVILTQENVTWICREGKQHAVRSPHVGQEQQIICHLRLAPRGSSWPWGRENRLGLRSSGTLKAISEYLDLIWLAITKIFWAVLLKDWAIIQISMCSLNSVLQGGYSCLFQFNTTTIYLELPRKRVLWWIGKYIN